jgi:hypothetical protein
MIRAAAIGTAILAAALCLAACGGGGTSSSDSTTTPQATKAPAGRAPQTPAEVAAERRAAGHAAAFVKADTDNSVPTFGSEAAPAERSRAERVLKLSHSKIKGCPAILAALSKGNDLSDPLVSGLLSLRVHAANAFALFYGPGHQQYFVPLLREGAGWKLTQLEPIAYPPTVGG